MSEHDDRHVAADAEAEAQAVGDDIIEDDLELPEDSAEDVEG